MQPLEWSCRYGARPERRLAQGDMQIFRRFFWFRFCTMCDTTCRFWFLPQAGQISPLEDSLVLKKPYKNVMCQEKARLNARTKGCQKAVWRDWRQAGTIDFLPRTFVHWSVSVMHLFRVVSDSFRGPILVCKTCPPGWSWQVDAIIEYVRDGFFSRVVLPDKMVSVVFSLAEITCPRLGGCKVHTFVGVLLHVYK